MQYTIWFSLLEVENSTVGSFTNESDLILVGNGGQAHHYLSMMPAADRVKTISVPITEQSFVDETGMPLTRDDLQSILANVEMLLIRATYHSETDDFAITNFIMDIATPTAGGGRVETVEECRCPAAYTGLSCESCSLGFTRFGSVLSPGALLGTCSPCQCNQHADNCHEITGVCIGCEDNTIGQFCEVCGPGYYGNATQGTDNDCIACPCSAPRSSSVECSVVSGEPVCTCSVGYLGQLCDKCSSNYFGDPQSPGGVCTQCDCNGNIDTNDTNSCNKTTGMCLNCLHNTDGFSCERCADGYFGDATRQNCQGLVLIMLHHSTGSKFGLCCSLYMPSSRVIKFVV